MHWYFLAGLVFEFVDMILRNEFMIHAVVQAVESFKEYKPFKRWLGYMIILLVACLITAINVVIWPANWIVSMVYAVRYQKEHSAF